MQLVKKINVFLLFFSPKKADIIASHKKYAFGICPENFGRALILTFFIRNILTKLDSNKQINVAVVGGYENEPEIRLLKFLGYKLSVTLFGIDKNMNKFDLNYENKLFWETHKSFDLVLCSQVLEHVWNHKSVFQNLYNLMSESTLLWLACPASNRPHASPHYFSAGFTSEYLTLNLQDIGLKVLEQGQIGSARNYQATHLLPAWLSTKGHNFPLFFAFESKSIPNRFLYTLIFLLPLLQLMVTSPRITFDKRYSTESWVVAKKHVDND